MRVVALVCPGGSLAVAFDSLGQVLLLVDLLPEFLRVDLGDLGGFGHQRVADELGQEPQVVPDADGLVRYAEDHLQRDAVRELPRTPGTSAVWEDTS